MSYNTKPANITPTPEVTFPSKELYRNSAFVTETADRLVPTICLAMSSAAVSGQCPVPQSSTCYTDCPVQLQWPLFISALYLEGYKPGA